ncbi:MAG: hypothetical protein WCK35_28920, partial [Chloroflexota bacterium]
HSTSWKLMKVKTISANGQYLLSHPINNVIASGSTTEKNCCSKGKNTTRNCHCEERALRDIMPALGYVAICSMAGNAMRATLAQRPDALRERTLVRTASRCPAGMTLSLEEAAKRDHLYSSVSHRAEFEKTAIRGGPCGRN